MKPPAYVTGNANKAKYFNDMTGLDIERIELDVDEIQSLDLREIVEYKARSAYAIAERPVIVEDTRLVFHALGELPGTLIKWFLEQLGAEGLCRILNDYDDRSCTAGAAIAYFDGTEIAIFERSLEGTVAPLPAGDNGFGWNQVFVPVGSDKTLGQMDDETFRTWYAKIKPFEEVGAFVKSL